MTPTYRCRDCDKLIKFLREENGVSYYSDGIDTSCYNEPGMHVRRWTHSEVEQAFCELKQIEQGLR